jgi:Ca2+-binding EF-hand superfamily protein
MDSRPRSLIIIRTEDRGESLHSPVPNNLLSSVAASLQDYQNSFTFLDKHGRGWVTKPELQMVLYRHEHVLGVHDFEELWNKYQINDGFNYLRLLKDASTKLPEETLAQLQKLRLQLKQASNLSPSQLFFQFDANKNGRVSTEEIVKYFESIGVQIDKTTMSRLVSCYTIDPRGLNFSQFISLLLPTEIELDPLGLELSVLLLPRQTELMEIFQSVDLIRTSKVSNHDFSRALSENITFSTDEIQTLFRLLEKDGQVSYKEIWQKIDEFTGLNEIETSAVEHLRDEYFDDIQKILKYLKRADGDKDGKNSFEELSEVLEKLGVSIKGGVQEIFSLLDTQNDGKVSILEFIVFIQNSLWESS